MTDEIIHENWKAVMASLPLTAQITANFKLFKPLPEHPNAKPEYINIEFGENEPLIPDVAGKRIEVIRIEAKYRKNQPNQRSLRQRTHST